MVQTLLNRSKKILETEHKSILSAAFVIAASYLASALLGLVRNHLLAARFFGGMEADLDVYFAAFVLPDTIFQLLVVGAVSAAFIPIFQDHLARSKAEAAHLANAALTTISLILFALTGPIHELADNFLGFAFLLVLIPHHARLAGKKIMHKKSTALFFGNLERFQDSPGFKLFQSVILILVFEQLTDNFVGLV